MEFGQPVPVNLTSSLPFLPTDAWHGESKPYPWAIGFATISLAIAIIITPSMFWHARNRNIGAAMIVVLAVYANFQSFLNAVLWPNDDLSSWYNGVGLCDFEVNVQLAVQVSFPASLSCILRALAHVLDTDNTVLMKTRSQQRREYAIDIFCCLVVPSLQFLLHYFVQGMRYYIFGIAGCVPSGDNSWLTIVLLIVPPFLWALADVYYAVLIFVRLLKYRRTISSVLANSNTPKARFFRLYLLCVVCVLGWFPTEIYILYVNISTSSGPYTWSGAHPPGYLDTAVYIGSNGRILYDRYIWLAGGLVVFFFFGFGRDAVEMYRAALLRLGFGRIFPALNRLDHSRATGDETGGSSRSKLRLLFSKGKDTIASFLTSRSSQSKNATSSDDDAFSPKFSEFSETIQEKSMHKPSFMSRFISRCDDKKNVLPTAQPRNHSPPAVQSMAFASPSAEAIRPLGSHVNERVAVTKEVHQKSEKNPEVL